MTKFYDSIDAHWANVGSAITGRKVTDEGYQSAQQFSKLVSTTGSIVSIYNGLAGYLNPSPAAQPVYPSIDDFGPNEIIDVDAMTDAQFDALDDIPDSEFDFDDVDSWIDDGTPTEDIPRVAHPDDIFIERDLPPLFTDEQWARVVAPETESQTFNVLGAIVGTGSISNTVYDYYHDSVPRGVAPLPITPYLPPVYQEPFQVDVIGETPTTHFPSSKSFIPQIYATNYYPNYNSIKQWLPSATTKPRRRRRKVRNA